MKHLLINFLGISIVLSFMVSGCKKEDTGSNAVDIYLAGRIQTSDNKQIAAYWKNGIVTRLTNGSNSATALGIVVIGGDVYVVGNDAKEGGIYWKNGVTTRLGIRSVARAITVNGNDVYIAGEDSIGAAYWKNGVVTHLPNAYSLIDCKACIAVQGDDVYVTADRGYWKNGQPMPLSNAPVGSRTSCITVTGSDVYIGGALDYTSNLAYWKNGVMTVLPQHSFGLATGIAVKGSDVYLSGSSTTSNGTLVGTYWKNTKATQLEHQDYVTGANGIAINGSDVYIAGGLNQFTNSSFGGAEYWKNGVMTTVDENGSAYAITVVPH